MKRRGLGVIYSQKPRTAAEWWHPPSVFDVWEKGRWRHGKTNGIGWLLKEEGMSRPPQWMANLNEQERTFVELYANTGKLRNSARLAGYNPDYSTALIQRPAIAEAVRKTTEGLIKVAGPIGFAVLMEFAQAEEVDPKVRLAAAKELVDRAHGAAAREMNIHVEHTTDKELMSRIESIAAQLGLPSPAMLEGEFEEVEEEQPDG